MMVNLPCLMVSCTNFLRPTCSYTECQLSFLTGSCPTEWTTVSYSSCLYLILTDLLLSSRKLIFSGRSLLFHRLVLLVMQCISHSIRVYGFPIQNPARFQILSAIRQGSGIYDSVLFLCHLFWLFVWSYYISQHFLRIICHPFCQDCKNHPQYLAGNHYQRLHLF